MSVRSYIQKTKWIRVVIPLVALTLYCVLFSLFLSWLLPEYHKNVNADFVDGTWKCSLLAAGVYLIFYAVYSIFIRLFLVLEDRRTGSSSRRKKVKRPESKNRIEKLDLILLLLPLTPIVQYILNNQDILSPLGSLYVLAVFLGFSVLFIIVLPTLLGITGSTKTLMILGLAFTFTITNMASLSVGSHWFERGDLLVQLSLLTVVFAASWLMYNLIGRKFLYILVAVFFIANTAIQLSSGDFKRTAPTRTDSIDNKLVELVGSRTPQYTPNIYLLIYDAYVANETMLQYGIDNSAQEEYLETSGFKLYPDAYSIGCSTLDSMSRTLNASTEYYGSERRAVSGDGVVQKLLKNFGYETCFVTGTDYFSEGIGSSWDFSWPVEPHSSGALSSHTLLINSVFMGEFRFDVEVATTSEQSFMQEKLGIFADVPNRPRFVYMHNDFPSHGPFKGASSSNEAEFYKARLDLANQGMKQDIETITQSDPTAIIIVAGDHGPYLTKNFTPNLGQYDLTKMSRLDIQSRFGCFLAIKWPTKEFSEYDDIVVQQDIFPAIFAYLFQDDTLLEARVESKTLHPELLSGAWVENGIIHGGINDGEPLFVDE